MKKRQRILASSSGDVAGRAADPLADDIRVLLGSGAGVDWRLVPGPRIRSGGRGPVGITIREQTGDATTDLVVVHADGNTVSVVPGVGGGFFRAVAPDVRTLPGEPGAGGTAMWTSRCGSVMSGGNGGKGWASTTAFIVASSTVASPELCSI